MTEHRTHRTPKVAVYATACPTDAPYVEARYPDGSVVMARNIDDVRLGFVSVTVVPHAVVTIDGELSDFDAFRRVTAEISTDGPWST